MEDTAKKPQIGFLAARTLDRMNELGEILKSLQSTNRGHPAYRSNSSKAVFIQRMININHILYLRLTQSSFDQNYLQ